MAPWLTFTGCKAAAQQTQPFGSRLGTQHPSATVAVHCDSAYHVISCWEGVPARPMTKPAAWDLAKTLADSESMSWRRLVNLGDGATE